MKSCILVVLILISSSSMADYDLSQNGKKVICYGADNLEVVLNASRKTLKMSYEGESAGSKKITKTLDNRRSSVAYTTSDGTLTLSDDGDTFQEADFDASEVDCK